MRMQMDRVAEKAIEGQGEHEMLLIRTALLLIRTVLMWRGRLPCTAKAVELGENKLMKTGEGDHSYLHQLTYIS
jgi:hypothetical protein